MGWDDRWLWYMEGNCLFLHLSRTGLGIYEVSFSATDGGFVITSALVECDRERYGRGSDFEEREELCALIFLVLDVPTMNVPPVLAPRKPELSAAIGDITLSSVGAIVNPASADLRGGAASMRPSTEQPVRNCVRIARYSVAANWGAPRFRPAAAAEIAVDTVRSTPTKVREIRFVCFDALTLEAYEEAINQSG